MTMRTQTKQWAKNRNEKLRQLRLDADLPIVVASRLAGVSPNVWWVWESWNIAPKSYETAKRVADLFGTTPEELGWQKPHHRI